MDGKLIFWAVDQRQVVFGNISSIIQRKMSANASLLSDKRYENKLENATKQTLKPLKPLAVLSQDQVYNS